MPFDYAYQLASADGRIFYGSSADHKVYALDLTTGKELWSFFTEGPVRFAPCVSGDRVFAASDDGRLYCLNPSDGKLIWQFRAARGDERLLGNEQMISRRPARSGVLVDGETAYFTAGMWGPDGVYVYALRARDGSVLWKNDTANQQYMLLPHNNFEGITGVSPQGYLALDEGVLLVPTGRAMPARFDSASGRLLPWNIAWGKHHRPGASWTMIAEGLFFGARRRTTGLPEPSLGENSVLRPEGLMAWDLHTGQAVFALDDVYRALISDNTLYLTAGGYSSAGGGRVVAVDFGKLPKGAEIPPPHAGGQEGAGVSPLKIDKQLRWQTLTGRTYELIKSKNVLIAGGNQVVRVLAAGTGKELWKTRVEGQARALAVASGRLLVSTSTGRLYCFGSEKVDVDRAPVVRAPAANAAHVERNESPSKKTQLAQQIIDKCGIRSGYCLVLGLDDPELPLGLIRQSDLCVIVIEEDQEKIARARGRYDRLGYYGVRIAIHRGNLKKLRYARYFANLIVVDRSSSADAADVYRCLRPCGGVLAIPAEDGSRQAREWLETIGADSDEVVGDGTLVRLKRGPLAGAGSWSHPFANAGRTSASRDELVRLPLKTLWFGGPGPARMVDRHRFAPIPVYANGRLFIPGQHCIIGVDAYNGREMWSRELSDVGRFPGQYRGASVVADEKCVYVPHGTNCVQLDGDTGQTVRIYHPPAEIEIPTVEPDTGRKLKDRRMRFVFNEVEWNYLAVTDDTVLGTIGAAQVRKSFANWPLAAPRGEYLFALSKNDGSTLWVHESEYAAVPNAIVTDGRLVYLIDQENDRGALGRATLRALDIDTGAVVWSQPIEDRWELLLEDNCLVAAGSGYTVFHADSGKLRWEKEVPFALYDTYGAGVDHYRWAVALRNFPVIPPMIVNGQILAPPRAFDLKTGEEKHRRSPLSGERMLPLGVGNGGCGTYSGCPSMIFMRSGSLGIYDLATRTGMHWLGQIRPGCWINTLPAGGMVLMPEGSSSCTCAYSFQTSLALVPDTRHEEWGVFTCEPPKQGSRLKTVSLNFGAVGDRRDESDQLWLGFPRPFSPQALKVPFDTCVTAEYYRQNADEISIAGTDRPWLYSCGVKGLVEATLDLNLTRPAVVLEAEVPPRLDGKLDDACWDGAEPIVLVDDSRRVDPGIRAWLRHDAENIYLGFRREASLKSGKPVPWTVNTQGDDAPTWQDDSLKVRFLPGDDEPFTYMFLSASGARFTGQGSRVTSIKRAEHTWQSAVHLTPHVWSAEIAIPAKPEEGLKIFLESFNRTGVGPERTFYKFRSWRRWFVTGGEANLTFRRPAPPPTRKYTVRLHFAELDRVKPGERVFDVKIQDKTVIQGLDVVSEAGGCRTALTREIQRVSASDTISISLLPSARSEFPPILSAIEITQDK